MCVCVVCVCVSVLIFVKILVHSWNETFVTMAFVLQVFKW